jgi:hypothetical protein
MLQPVRGEGYEPIYAVDGANAERDHLTCQDLEVESMQMSTSVP